MRSSLAIVDELRAQIFAGMRAGDRLGTEVELAERFGVSRITMRDAVRALEAEGLVEVSVGTRGGLRVADGDAGRATEALSAQLYLQQLTWQELVDAMAVLETATVRLAAERATPEDVVRLGALIEHPLSAHDADFTDQALDFHQVLAQIGGNRALLAAVRALRGAQRRLFAADNTADTAASVTEMHGRIHAGIAAGDADAAAEAMSEHLGRLRDAAGRHRSADRV